jgi:hypothetical protein
VAPLDLDLPSVLATDVGASATTTRTATSVVGDARTYVATADPGDRFRVTVTPARFTVPAHGSVTLRIQIDAAGASAGWHATTIRIHRVGGGADLHLPVAFRKVQAGLQVATACTPDPLGIGQTGTCTLTATNLGAVDATVHLKTSLPAGLALASASGATPTGPGTVETHGPLVAARPAGLRLRIALPNEDPGFVDLGASPFNVPPIAVGDETAVVLTPGPYTLLGQRYTTLTVASNGLAIAGSTTSPVDISATPRAFPDPLRPNAVFAPFWTDLDGSGADGIRATQLTDAAGRSWLVVQWNVTVKGTGDPRVFELWLGLGATTTSFFTYDLANLPSAVGLAGPLSIGFEDATGTRGDGLGLNLTSTHDLELGQLPATPPGILSYGVGFTATAVGVQTIATTLDSAQVPGTVVDLHDVTVHP